MKALQPLRLDQNEAQVAMYLGLIWLDPSNWAGVPISIHTGRVSWEVEGSWKLLEYLPPAAL